MLQQKLRWGMLCAIITVGPIGCAAEPLPRGIYQDSLTIVQLRADTKATEAHDHPATVAPEQLTAILEGVRIQHRRDPVVGLLVGKPEVTPVFSTNDVMMLAAPIVRALAMASPKDIVTFSRKVADSRGGAAYTTGGLFVDDGLFYLIIANHRAVLGPTMVRDTPIYPIDPSEEPLLSVAADPPVLTFARGEAEVRPSQWSGRYDHGKTIVIDPTLAQRHQRGTTDQPAPQK